jgi:threonine/homoserine/homoserine lactone efflux protein
MTLEATLLFAATIFAISMTPGLCMTLAFTLGMRFGYRRTLWMMAGELTGVATVAISVAFGVVRIVAWQPNALQWLTWIGAAYLLFVGVSMWRQAGAADMGSAGAQSIAPIKLAVLGYSTAVFNPKGWAFLIAILPGFLNEQQSIASQLAILIPIFLVSEFVAMSLYATGGKTLARWLSSPGQAEVINKVAAAMIIIISLWFVAGV